MVFNRFKLIRTIHPYDSRFLYYIVDNVKPSNIYTLDSSKIHSPVLAITYSNIVCKKDSASLVLEWPHELKEDPIHTDDRANVEYINTYSGKFMDKILEIHQLANQGNPHIDLVINFD